MNSSPRHLCSLWIGLVAAGISISALLPAAAQATQAAREEAFTLEAILIWATNDERSPDPTHKAIGPHLTAKLKKGPYYKWKNYFEVSRKQETLAARAHAKMEMSDRCVLEVRNLADGRVEVKLIGDGKRIWTHKESMPPEGILVLGGDAENDTAWLIVLRRIQPRPAAAPPPAPAAPASPAP